ncbi:hypothetical protein AXF42_Ash003826 [Apostasia shenzhenica]|uniref:RNase H type-1 domain-containing protein n=1 Tax=Apostasia shenzhenica TaxID=1088818 RepID=A0A2I0AI03_9ASPA|nr:hypothetical protein AXF42_Ash003826 [Apostasia shenzhenica]
MPNKAYSAVRIKGAAIGALICNSEGQLLEAKGQFLSTQAVNIAELHAAFLAADLVKPWIGKFQGVWFEGDSEHTIHQLQQAVQRPHHASSIEFHGFLPTLFSFSHYKISHVYRQANMAAHYVASSSFVSNKELVPPGSHVYGCDAALEPRVNISPPHWQGANINVGLGMRTITMVDALPKACQDKARAAPCRFTFSSTSL